MTKQNKIILKIFTGLVLIVLILIVADFLLPKGWDYYNQWKGEKKIDELVKEIKRIEKEDYEQKLADKIGGKTPQETLDLFIQAIEKNDYELASKYFIIEKQEEELKSLQNSKKEDINNIISVIRQTTLVNKRAILEKMYENNVKQYHFTESKEDYIERVGKIYTNKETMNTKLDGYNFDVDFILYPSGNWKIEEI